MPNLFGFTRIKEVKPMFREGQPASNIEYVTFTDNDYRVVSQKGIFRPNDEVCLVYIDTNLLKNELWDGYINPTDINGNPVGSKLGGDNRVRSIKFNFQDENGDLVYSQGIAIPAKKVYNFLTKKLVSHESLDDESFEKEIGLTKISTTESEQSSKTGTGIKPADQKGNLPFFLYKTDEPHLQKKCIDEENTKTYGFFLKRDGQSITVYNKSTSFFGICTRSVEKKLDAEEITYEGYRRHVLKPKKEELLANPELKPVVGWWNKSEEKFLTQEEFDAIKETIPCIRKRIVSNELTTGLPILKRMRDNYAKFAVRGELFGAGINGRKNNKDSKLPLSFECFGIDEFDDYGNAKRIPMQAAMRIAEQLQIPFVKLFETVETNDKKVIKEICDRIFKENPGIEGIVIRSMDDNSFSAKYLSPEYDALK